MLLRGGKLHQIRIAYLLAFAGCSAAKASSIEVGVRTQLSTTVPGGDSALVVVRVRGVDQGAEEAVHLTVASKDSVGSLGHRQPAYYGRMRNVRLLPGTYEIVVRLLGYRPARGEFTIGPREQIVLHVRLVVDPVRLQEISW